MNFLTKKRINQLLEKGGDDLLSKAVDVFIVLLILINILVVILETINELNVKYSYIFEVIDIFCVMIFSLEYILRLWCCNEQERYRGAIKGRLKYIFSPMAVIELLAILPFYLSFLTIEWRLLRLIRLFRILRLLKLLRYSESLLAFRDVLRLKSQELTMVFLVILFLIIFSSGILYHFEHEAQPDTFSSIPAAMWWSVAALTTVGYGDIVPITIGGKISAAVLALVGIGTFALPAGILGSGFIKIVRRKSGGSFPCPHCGKDIKRDSSADESD